MEEKNKCVHLLGYEAAYRSDFEKCKSLKGKSNINVFIMGASSFLEDVTLLDEQKKQTQESKQEPIVPDSEVKVELDAKPEFNQEPEAESKPEPECNQEDQQNTADKPLSFKGQRMAEWAQLSTEEKAANLLAAKQICNWSLDNGACLLFSFRSAKKRPGVYNMSQYGKNISMLRGPGDIGKGSLNQFLPQTN